MKYSLDQTTDFSFRELHAFLSGVEIPEYVKNAEMLTKEAADTLPDSAFADQYHRAFPIKSAEDTYLSNVHFVQKRAELTNLWGENYVNDVATRLIKAAELFNIYGDLQSIIKV